jgi:hypothetical protein
MLFYELVLSNFWTEGFIPDTPYHFDRTCFVQVNLILNENINAREYASISNVYGGRELYELSDFYNCSVFFEETSVLNLINLFLTTQFANYIYKNLFVPHSSTISSIAYPFLKFFLKTRSLTLNLITFYRLQAIFIVLPSTTYERIFILILPYISFHFVCYFFGNITVLLPFI